MNNQFFFSIYLDLLDSFRSLKRKKVQSLLSTLGVFIGVTSIIVMISILQAGLEKAIKHIEELGVNTIRIKNINLPKHSLSKLNLSQGLSDNDILFLKKFLTNKDIITRVYKTQGEISYKSKIFSGIVIGTDDNYLKVENLKLTVGRNFLNFDIKYRKFVALISKDIFIDFLNGKLNKELLIKNQLFKIIGVIDNENYKNTIIIPYSVFKLIYNVSHFDEINLYIADKDTILSLKNKINKILQLTHNSVNDYKIMIPLEMIEKERESRKLNYIIIMAIASMSLVTGGIGIMNIMLANISEKTREIGIRLTVGATPNRIIRLVLFDSIILTLIGELLGFITALIVIIFFKLFTELNVVLSIKAIMISFFMGTITGILSGLYPGIKASKIEPFEALREF